MHVKPTGLPAALKAWRERPSEPLLTMRCGAAADCDTEVGAVYRTTQGTVVESRISPPWREETGPAVDLNAMAEELGIVGLVDHDITSTAKPERDPDVVMAQIDMLGSDLYWQNPKPVCPEHGALVVDRDELSDALRHKREAYEAKPA